ncbi:hypothetical protein GW17_00036568, partial [Ensete ventricosum]
MNVETKRRASRPRRIEALDERVRGRSKPSPSQPHDDRTQARGCAPLRHRPGPQGIRQLLKPGTTACVPTLDMIYQLKMSVSELVEACPLTVDEIRG